MVDRSIASFVAVLLSLVSASPALGQTVTMNSFDVQAGAVADHGDSQEVLQLDVPAFSQSVKAHDVKTLQGSAIQFEAFADSNLTGVITTTAAGKLRRASFISTAQAHVTGVTASDRGAAVGTANTIANVYFDVAKAIPFVLYASGSGTSAPPPAQLSGNAEVILEKATPQTFVFRLTTDAPTGSTRIAGTLQPGSYLFTAFAGAQAGEEATGAPIGTFATELLFGAQPDLVVGGKGGGVHNATGKGQTAKVNLSPGAKQTLAIEVQNDGPVAGSFVVLGSGSADPLTVRYLAGDSGPTDITASVVAGTYAVSNLLPGQSRTIRMKVVAAGNAAPGTVGKLRVQATSTKAPPAEDLVKAQVKIVP